MSLAMRTAFRKLTPQPASWSVIHLRLNPFMRHAFKGENHEQSQSRVNTRFSPEAFADGAVGGALESDDFVSIGIVRHDKDIAIGADGKFVYTINSQSGNIGVFASTRTALSPTSAKPATFQSRSASTASPRFSRQFAGYEFTRSPRAQMPTPIVK